MAEAEEQYVCTLSNADLEKAQKELHEDPKNRIGAVETFRQWINEQPHLKANTSTPFLLRYLRGAKFSQLKAREILEWTLRSKNQVPTWVNDLVVTDEMIKFLKSHMFMLPLPKRDKNGQRIILCQEGGFDPSIHSKELVMRTCWVVGQLLLRDEATQVNGLVYLMDLSHFSLKHQTFWKLDDMRKMMNIFQKGMPGRFKGFHYYNMNPFFETVMQLCLPLFTKKFKDRIILHGSNLESVYKDIPMELLPVEYLPDDYKGPNAGTMKDIMENVINELRDPAFQVEVAEESSTKYYIDDSKKPADDEPVGSFRKLNVD